MSSAPSSARLEVDLVSGLSAVTAAYASNPLKLLTPQARGPSVWAYTSSFGGGLVAGDQTRLDLRLGAGARCYVSTQSSTKVYRNPGALPSGHTTQARLEPGAVLVYAPEPVQAFAHSNYDQRQQWHLSAGAGLVLVDWFSAGRAACGERWAFHHFHTRQDVLVDGERVFLDSLLLEPAKDSLGANHAIGSCECFALLLLIGEPCRRAASQLLEEVSARPISRGSSGDSSVLCSASPVGDGALLRLAGGQVESVRREWVRHLQFCSQLLGDNPWQRRW